jgi:ADP-L-glycero-D-manno-heptose 6-epimerase
MNSQGTIVVTGGAGLIGSAVIWGLNNRKLEDIWLVDEWEDNSPKARNIKHLAFNKAIGVNKFREMIRNNKEDCSEIKTIFHLGACSSTTEKNEAYLHDNNYLYTRELCEWSLENGIRFIYASSAATYGDGSMGMDDMDDDLAKLEPLNPYGWSKHKFDLWAQGQGVLDQIIGLKYFNVFGPNEEHKAFMRSVVSKSFEQISQSGEMTLFKSHRPEYRDGEQQRDFLYVKDAVNMTICNAIFKALVKEHQILFVDMPDILREKYQYFTQAKIDKLRKCGYPDEMFSLEEAVRDYVTGYLVPDLRLGS